MAKKILWGLAILFFLAMGVYVLTQVDLTVFSQISVSTLVYLIILNILTTIVYAIGVQIYLKGMGYNVSLKKLYMVINGSGTASSVSNVKLGIPLRVYLFKQILGVPISIGAASVVLETAVWFFINPLIMAIGAPIFFGAEGWVSILAAVGLIVVISVGFLLLPRIEALIPNRMFKINTRKLRDFITEFRISLSAINKTKLVTGTLIMISNYLLEALCLYLIFKEFGWILNIFELTFVIVFAYLVGLFSLIPMGIGPQDISLVYLLTRLGVTQDIGAAAAVINRLTRVVIPIIIGLISINLLGVNIFKSTPELPQNGPADISDPVKETQGDREKIIKQSS
jgi:uncharacterized protein (TIRG00374 family)